ncbi:phage holin family protein [Leminorella grimontii]|uniref:phage holin family protein n=1 Tax=Leminorella grimontii TaxID=82981 RepID=UPI00207E8C90|nr:phage holin family protein [Leminorella grimontii]GKX60662.1 hypothetical protein SOASR031_29770 [Leminorella grimontii]
MRMHNNYRDFMAALAAWYSANSGWVNGGIIAATLTFSRVMYGGGKIKAAFVDAVITGIVAVTSTPVVTPLIVRVIESFPLMNGVLTPVDKQDLELFVFAAIGGVGAKVIREIGMAMLKRGKSVLLAAKGERDNG